MVSYIWTMENKMDELLKDPFSGVFELQIKMVLEFNLRHHFYFDYSNFTITISTSLILIVLMILIL